MSKRLSSVDEAVLLGRVGSAFGISCMNVGKVWDNPEQADAFLQAIAEELATLQTFVATLRAKINTEVDTSSAPASRAAATT